jgi:transposase
MQTIVMEACQGSNHWGRKLQSLGYTVKLINPQFVKPYVKSNKNDYNDAEAIVGAASRDHMRFVSIKSVEQQDIQMLHRLRERSMVQRTQIVNQIRGLLLEYGITIPQGITHFRKRFFQILRMRLLN